MIQEHRTYHVLPGKVQVTYVLTSRDLEHLNRGWQAVYGDEAMVAYLAEGARVDYVENKALRPVRHSPLP